MRVGRRISVTALNANIDADLDLGLGHILQCYEVRGRPAMFISNPSATNLQTIIMGSSGAPGAGARIGVYGKTHGTNAGQFGCEVPNTAGNADIGAFILRPGDTPYLDMLSHRIAALAQATTDMDAAPQTKMWGTWSPTLVWSTATPASLSTVARYCQIGKTVFFTIYLNSTDSNATTNLTITLPVTAKDNTANVAISGLEIAGAAGTTYYNPIAWLWQNTSMIYFGAFTAGTDGQRICINVSGMYEAA